MGHTANDEAGGDTPSGAAPEAALPGEVLAAAALARLLAGQRSVNEARGVDPWDIPDGWRVGGSAWTKFRFAAGAGTVAEVRVRGLASAAAEVAVGDADPVPARAEFRAAAPSGADPTGAGLRDANGAGAGLPAAGGRGVGGRGTDLVLTYGGRVVRFVYATDGATTWLGRDGYAWALTEEDAAPARGDRAGGADGTVRSPMPGAVLAVHVAVGQQVTAGQAIAVVEAMKMEHMVTAPLAGTVSELSARTGQQVQLDQPLAIIEPAPDHDGES